MRYKTMPDFEKAEHLRLIDEIQKDRELQFRIFWQALTITAVLMSLSLNLFKSEILQTFPFIFLTPHLILLPSTSIILNRARTANRKNGYILVVFDKFSNFSNWEKDLSWLRAKDKERDAFEKPPHRPATLKSMLITITTLELGCIILFWVLLFTSNVKNNFYTEFKLLSGGLYFIIYCLLIAKRFRSFFCIRYETSIQGYATAWADVLSINKNSIHNFPDWDIKNKKWIATRNEEVTKYRIKNGAKEKWNLMVFIWKIIYKKPDKNYKKPLEKSYIKAITIATIVWIIPSVFFIAAKFFNYFSD